MKAHEEEEEKEAMHRGYSASGRRRGDAEERGCEVRGACTLLCFAAYIKPLGDCEFGQAKIHDTCGACSFVTPDDGCKVARAGM
jgi:hypothetical protein